MKYLKLQIILIKKIYTKQIIVILKKLKYLDFYFNVKLTLNFNKYFHKFTSKKKLISIGIHLYDL